MASGGVNDDENKLRKKLIECLIRCGVSVDGDFAFYDDGDCEVDLCDIRQLAAELILEGVKP